MDKSSARIGSPLGLSGIDRSGACLYNEVRVRGVGSFSGGAVCHDEVMASGYGIFGVRYGSGFRGSGLGVALLQVLKVICCGDECWYLICLLITEWQVLAVFAVVL